MNFEFTVMSFKLQKIRRNDIFVRIENNFATSQNIFVISRKIFVRTVQNIFSDGLKIYFGRSEIYF